MAPSTYSRLSSRHTNPIEPAIGFDPQEEARIRLEQEIGGISLDFSHTGSSSLSLEYGRHGAPSPHFEGVASFARYDSDLERSRDASARRNTRQQQSSRTVDDSYDGGNTQSTAAHHASGLTVGAGLGYGTAARSLSRAGSGAEYDPDRELSDMLKRRGRISVLDDTNTTRADRNRSITNKKHSLHITADPLIVDDTAELDHILETGHLPEHTLRTNPRIPRAHPTENDSHCELDTQSSFHRSEADDSTASRRKPRLADALGGTFSPKRPRTMTTNTLSPNGTMPKPLPAITSMAETSVRPNASLLASRASSYPSGGARPESSLSSSNGTQKARLEANTAANARRAAAIKASPAAPVRRSTAPAVTSQPESVVDKQRREVAEARTKAFMFPREPMSETRNRTGMSLHLPDVTGLTAAVESPSKAYIRYRDAQVGMPTSDLEADRTMTNAQIEELSERLRELERENGTARRRVRELEMELDYCKAEVERERTRANTQDAERQAATERAERDRRMRQTEEAASQWEGRYREVVEEKTALEALVTTLRSHLARMTSEVEEHQRTIDDLRSMHERDAAELEAKTAEVAAITAEVERLATECERLRGVVEEGLRERRQVREGGSVQASGSQCDFEGSGSVIMGRVGMVELSAVAEEEEEQDGTEMAETEMEQDRSVLSVTELAADDSAMRSGKMRTDRATLGSVSRTLRFMDPAPSQSDDATPELERSRSSIRSADQSAPQTFPSRSSTPVMDRRRAGSPTSRRAQAGSSPGSTSRGYTAATRATSSHAGQSEKRGSPPPEQRTPPQQRTALPSQSHRPTSPQPQQRRSPAPAPQSPPFPRIRGTQLERVFFSVPDHNERTCTKCCAQRRVQTARDDRHEPQRARERERAHWRLGGRPGRRADDDEGYVEGDEEIEVDVRKPPPQTVLVKVVRELEDDFAHYKAIYVELADQYRIIGPASNVAKRNVLAEHLKEVIDTLEKKGNQIASLYDLLTFNDKPTAGPSKQ